MMPLPHRRYPTAATPPPLAHLVATRRTPPTEMKMVTKIRTHFHSDAYGKCLKTATMKKFTDRVNALANAYCDCFIDPGSNKFQAAGHSATKQRIMAWKAASL